MKEVFWEKSFKNKKISTFGNPSEELCEEEIKLCILKIYWVLKYKILKF